MPPVGQPIDSTSSHLPVAPIDVTAAATSGTLTVSLVDTATLSGNAPLYLVLREQATGRVLDSQLLFPARLTATSTAQPGLPTVIASTTVPVSSAVAGSTLYYHQDGLGTVTELTDTNGSVAKAYDAYGNLLESPGTVEQPYTYTGRELDAETGLYYYRARYYDPTTGRFLQKDPIFNPGFQIYGYVEGIPTLFVDPYGLRAGPKHPRVSTKCRRTDSCSTLQGKIQLLEKTIRSHVGWDRNMPSPRGGGRHQQEISDWTLALGRCLDIFEKKCRRCPPEQQGAPQPSPGTASASEATGNTTIPYAPIEEFPIRIPETIPAVRLPIFEPVFLP